MLFEICIAKLKHRYLATPANKLIAQTALQQWRLILTAILTASVAALTEGMTLAVIFLAVDILSGGSPLTAYPWLQFVPWTSGISAIALVMLLMGLAVIAQASQAFMRYVNRVSIGAFAARCRSRVTSLIHKTILSYTFSCASGYKVGDLTSFAAAGPLGVKIQIESISEIVVSSLMALIYLAILFGISPWLLVAAVIMAAIISFFQKFLEPKIKRGADRQASIEMGISARIVEDYQALRLLHSTGFLEEANRNLQDLMGDMERAFLSQTIRLSLLEPVTSLMPVVAIAGIVSLSLIFLGGSAGGVLAGLITFVLALQRLNMRLGSIAASLSLLADNTGRIGMINTILSKTDKKFRRLGGVRFSKLRDKVEFSDVSLCYDEKSGIRALDKVNFLIHKGQTIALVGPSGAGKSSLSDLIIGLYRPSTGSIKVDGVSIDTLDLASWQQRLGVVSQDTFLFNASIAENLTFGLEHVTYKQIRRAAQQAQADCFISALPHGYETLVGERGYRLSGGQRQRLSLARALLRKPDLLILDEATSALDTESERLVQEAIQGVDSSCTVLVIAHRLSTVVNADQILVMDKGRIIERGSHHQLLRADGLYSRLWLKQSEAASG